MFKNNSNSIKSLVKSEWDVSNVEDMSHMFVNRYIFNQKDKNNDDYFSA